MQIIKEKNIIDQIDELELDDVSEIKDLFGKAIEQYNKIAAFKEILSTEFKTISNKLGEAKAEKDHKSNENKIFLNKKWYDRMHVTEKSIVKSQINKVFDSYVRGKINDEDAKRQLNNIVNRHQRFFNSIYC